MPNRVVAGEEAREAVMRGVKTVALAVKQTLGPRGRNTLLVRPYGAPAATRDGVTVAKEIDLEDPQENAGARLVKAVASSADEEVGDGTTTAVVLAEAMLIEGMKRVAAGIDRIRMARGLSTAAKAVGHCLRAIAVPAAGEQIRQAATISLHGDAEIADKVYAAIEAVGPDGCIEFDDSPTRETTIERRPGFQWEQGWMDMGFVTDPGTMTSTLENPLVLVSERPLIELSSNPTQQKNQHNFYPLFNAVGAAQRELLIVAPDVTGDALVAIAVNMRAGKVKSCAVKPPGFGQNVKEHIEDLAIATGARVLAPKQGRVLRDFTLDDLGSCGRAVIRRDRTVLVELGGDESALKERAESLRIRRDEMTEDPFDKEQLSHRIARLTTGVAVIRIGGATSQERAELKTRVQDAVFAARAAAKEGIVPGGGVALLAAGAALEGSDLLARMDREEREGAAILLAALRAPLRQIVLNAGDKPDVVEQEVLDHLSSGGGESGWWGFDAASRQYGDLIEAGVVDPVKVTRVALEKAASIAGLLLTTEAAVVYVPQPTNAAGSR